MKLSLFTLASFPLVVDMRPFVAPFETIQKKRGTHTSLAAFGEEARSSSSLFDDEEEDLPTTLHVRAFVHA